jgi:hypothetical protein
MAALNFPSSPTLGQTHTENGKVWVWTGYAWVTEATGLTANDIGVTVQGYDADISTVSASQAEMEAGTESALRSMSPLRVKQAIDALAPPVTIADSTSIDLTLTGQQISAAAIFGTTSGTVAEGNHAHASLYQPLDADLTAIAGLSGTTGLLKKTAADTWTLDTTAYTTNLGTVTSVGGTGTVNGLTLSGTVTSSGSLTLGGTLDLSSPPAIGGTTPAAGTFTTLGATGNVTLGDASGDTVSLRAGTAALPTLIPNGDPNTGLWFPAADTIAASTAGSERLRIDSSGTLLLRQSSNAANTSVSFNTTAQNALTLDSTGALLVGVATKNAGSKVTVADSFGLNSAGAKTVERVFGDTLSARSSIIVDITGGSDSSSFYVTIQMSAYSGFFANYAYSVYKNNFWTSYGAAVVNSQLSTSPALTVTPNLATAGRLRFTLAGTNITVATTLVKVICTSVSDPVISVSYT